MVHVGLLGVIGPLLAESRNRDRASIDWLLQIAPGTLKEAAGVSQGTPWKRAATCPFLEFRVGSKYGCQEKTDSKSG
jgi:hypothetical protein